MGPTAWLIDLISALAGGEPVLFLLGEDFTPPYEMPRQGTGPFSVDVRPVPTKLLLGDTAALEQWLSDAGSEQYRMVALLPPLGTAGRGPRAADRSEDSTINMLASVRPSVDLSVLLPRSTLSGMRAVGFRNEIVKTGRLATVIEIAASEALEGIHPTFGMGLIHIAAETSDKVAFFSHSVDLSADLSSQLDQLRSGEHHSPDGFMIQTSTLDPAIGLSPSFLDPTRAERVADAQALGELRPVEQIYEVLRGRRGQTKPRTEPDPGDLRVITGRNVRGGRLEFEDERGWMAAEDGVELVPGDVVVRVIAGPGSNLVAAPIGPEHEDLLAGPDLVVLRPKDEWNPALQRILVTFLQSDRMRLQLRSLMSGSAEITPRELSDALVPEPDAAFVAAFEAVSTAADDFRRWLDESEQVLAASFDAEDLGVAKADLISRSIRLRQRADTAASLDDLAHRVATRYPLPIAFRWRGTIAVEGTGGELEEILKTQEVLLGYVGIMAILLARRSGIDIAYVADVRKRFAKARGGITLGDWRAVLQDAADGRKFRRLSPGVPLGEVRSFFADAAVVEASKRLTNLRNDRAHLREFGPHERDEAVGQARVDLRTLASAAEFVTDYPLVRIVGTSWDSLHQTNSVKLRSLVGDSPVVPVSMLEHASSEIEKGSLYLRTSENELLLLRPLLIGRDCPHCGHWSTFLPDTGNHDGTINYKSFEHGHSVKVPSGEVAGLAHFGLLERKPLQS